MCAGRDDPCNGRMDNPPQLKGLAQVTSRLCARFPDRSSTEIEAMVSRLFAEYSGSRIRDFVPIFVEREAVQELSGRREPVPA